MCMSAIHNTRLWLKTGKKNKKTNKNLLFYGFVYISLLERRECKNKEV